MKFKPTPFKIVQWDVILILGCTGWDDKKIAKYLRDEYTRYIARGYQFYPDAGNDLRYRKPKREK